jgi:hypothetical protein
VIGNKDCKLQFVKASDMVACKAYAEFPSMLCGAYYNTFCPLVEKEISHIKKVGHRCPPSRDVVRKRLTKRLEILL